MDFWSFLGYILSFISELFNLTLFSVTIQTGEVISIQLGSLLISAIILTVLFHLLTPSARGI